MIRNDHLPAGWPMCFSCVDCAWPIWVPENYVAKPLRCEGCGGPWSEGPIGPLLERLVEFHEMRDRALASLPFRDPRKASTRHPAKRKFTKVRR